MIANQPVRGTTGASTGLAGQLTKLKCFWKRWLLCTRTCPVMHPYSPRTAPALQTQWNKKKTSLWRAPCRSRPGHEIHRSLPKQRQCVGRQSLRATHVKECSKGTSKSSRNLPSTVQLADPGQNTVQDLMQEVPVHADVVHV